MIQSLRNVRLKTISYLLIAFMILAGAIAMAASLSTLREASDAKAAWDSYDGGAAKRSRIMADLRDALGYGGLVHNFKNAVIRGDRNDLEAAREKGRIALTAIAEYREQELSPTEVAAITEIEDTVRSYIEQFPELEQLIRRQATVEEIDDAVRVGETSATEGFDALDHLLREERAEAEQQVHEAVASAQQFTYLTLVIIAAMVVSLIAVFLWFAQSRLIKPLYALMDFVARVGRGDLSEKMTNLGRDEVGALATQLNEMVTNLKEIALQTRAAVSNLNSAAAETLASTKQQAASVAEQFAAIQQTTATLNEISQSSQQMTSRADEIARQAETTSERSKDGLKAMDEMAQVMDAIETQTESAASQIVALSEKTQAIGDIIATVNDVSERSQLLALNAAIEAAAAGEEGRSFSVVAEEMKSLADQAKSATAQVSSILSEIQKGINSSVMSTEESVKRVASGREQAENTLRLISEFATTTDSSIQAFEQIVAATNQQRVGLEQVVEALQQIRAGSEQTASGTKQIEISVANINTLGSQLDHTMERYVV